MIWVNIWDVGFKLYLSEISFNKLFFSKVGKFVEAFFVGFFGVGVVFVNGISWFLEYKFSKLSILIWFELNSMFGLPLGKSIGGVMCSKGDGHSNES